MEGTSSVGVLQLVNVFNDDHGAFFVSSVAFSLFLLLKYIPCFHWCAFLASESICNFRIYFSLILYLKR